MPSAARGDDTGDGAPDLGRAGFGALVSAHAPTRPVRVLAGVGVPRVNAAGLMSRLRDDIDLDGDLVGAGAEACDDGTPA